MPQQGNRQALWASSIGTALGSTSRQSQGGAVNSYIELLGVKKKSVKVTDAKMTGSNISGHRDPRFFFSFVNICDCCWRPWSPKGHERKLVMGERVHFAYRSQSVIKGRWARNSRQEFEAKTIEDCCLLGCPATIRIQLKLLSRNDTNLRELGLFTSVIRKVPHRYGHKPIWWRQVLCWSSSSEVCRVDNQRQPP